MNLPSLLSLTLVLLSSVACAQRAGAPHLDDAIDAADVDHDGKVSLVEFSSARSKRFHQMDKNEDGFLTQDDLGRLAKRRTPVQERFKQSIREADVNADGRLGFAEFLDTTPRLFGQLDANKDGYLTTSEMDSLKKR